MTTKNYYKTLKTLVLSIFMGCSVLSTQAQIYVDASATNGANDGSSWDDAYTDLQRALDAAAKNAEIRVAAGTYTPTETPDETTGDNRDKAFHFNEDLVLKGSYNTVSGKQDFTSPSILSGDFNGDDTVSNNGSITKNTENAYHVFMTANLTTETQIEGFLIIGGHADASFFNNTSYGGQNFVNNTGGGMYNHTSSPSLINMVFSGNEGDNGGGMTNTNASPSIVNTVFSGNSVNFSGGGMYNSASSPSIVNSTFSGNKANNSGDGIRNTSSSTLTIYNSVFYGNDNDDITNGGNSSITAESNFSEYYYTSTGFTRLTADPFLDSENPKGADGIWFTADDGLHPGSAISPITDSGDAARLPSDTSDFDKDEDVIEAIPIDIRGRNRELGVSVDAGAYEFDSTTVLSLKDRDSSSLEIYSTGYKTLVIHGLFNAKTTANVYSLQGKLVASKTFEKFSTSNSLDVSTLSTGIYIVKMYNVNHQVHTKKLFIQ
ncbi:MAG: T9SS type A sorting domain-containing protein [Polaribacter sp.]